MKNGIKTLALTLTCVAVPLLCQGASPERFKAHMSLLADDLLEGRDTGSKGHDFAALYIATELQKLGIKPGGENGTYYQEVPFKQSSIDMKSPTLSVSNGTESLEFTFMNDMLMSGDINQADSEVEGELVFVGFGVDAPYYDYSDFDGVDLTGKIAVYLLGRPLSFPSEEGAHYLSEVGRSVTAHGAKGIIVLNTPIYETIFPFEKRKMYVRTPRTRWVSKEGAVHDGFPEIKGAASLSLEASKALMEMAGIDIQTLYQNIEDQVKPQARTLGLTARMSKKSVLSETTSPNVIGILEGSDPELKDEYIILTAHADHIGVSQHSVLKDKINNGAMDNASGVSTLLEMAYEFYLTNDKPRRSIIFAFVTGEEKGLLGSEYYAEYPTVPIENIVANVNLDMPILTYRTDRMIAFGAQHSSLESSVRDTLLSKEMDLIEDPMPEQAIFVRSDQYSLVKKGVPAVYLVPGIEPSDPEALGMSAEEFVAAHYHMPSDDLNLPIDYEWAAQFVDINYSIAASLANADETPNWNEDSFFRTFATTPAP